MKEKREDILLEWGITIFPVLFIIIISIWHAFGVNGIQPWKAIYFLSNHLLVIYLALLIYFTCGISALRRIMLYMLVPYMIVKIIYQVLIWINASMGTDKFLTYVWGLICVITFLIGAIITWKQLRKIG